MKRPVGACRDSSLRLPLCISLRLCVRLFKFRFPTSAFRFIFHSALRAPGHYGVAEGGGSGAWFAWPKAFLEAWIGEQKIIDREVGNCKIPTCPGEVGLFAHRVSGYTPTPVSSPNFSFASFHPTKYHPPTNDSSPVTSFSSLSIMKTTYVVTLLTFTLATATASFAQGKRAKPTAPAKADVPSAQPGQEQRKLIKVASLNTIEANREFQANLRLVQQQRALAVQVTTQIEEQKDEQEKARLQAQLDALIAKLNANNRLMIKNYGFSLNRNYVLTVEKSHVYLFLSEEEAKKVEPASVGDEKK